MGSDEEQAALLEAYCRQLEQNPTAAPPVGLDAELAEQAKLLRRGLDAPAPALAYRTRLKAQLETTQHSATSAEEAPIMPMLPDIGAGRFTPPTPTSPLRRWFFPRLATAAVAALIVVIGWFLLGKLNNPTAPLSAAQILQRAQAVFTDGSIKSMVITETITRRFAPNTGAKLPPSVHPLAETVTSYTGLWYQAPNLWRTESSVASTNGPSVDREISDGANIWSYSFANPREGAILVRNQVDINLFSSLSDIKAGVPPLVHVAKYQFDTVQTVMRCYKPTLARSEVIGGRVAYVINSGDTPCQPHNRYTIWIDQNTFFPLRIDTSTQLEPGETIVSDTINAALNQPIDPGVFTFTPPPSATFNDHRPQAPSQHLPDTPTP